MNPIHNKVISVGDLVKEHTVHSKHRVGLVVKVSPHKDNPYWVDIEWLDGTIDNHKHHIYEVTKVCNKCMQQK